MTRLASSMLADGPVCFIIASILSSGSRQGDRFSNVCDLPAANAANVDSTARTAHPAVALFGGARSGAGMGAYLSLAIVSGVLNWMGSGWSNGAV
eukprot:576730-Pleurochrysis_carterae.AAC.1